MQCFFRRFVEAILLEFVLSLLIIIFARMGLVKNDLLALIFSSIFAVIYLVWTVICLFGYRMSIDGKKTYYITNFFVYSVLSALVMSITIAIHFLGEGKLSYYLKLCNSLLFFPFKVFHYFGRLAGLRIGFSLSAAIFSVIIFIIVAVLPLLVNKKKYLKRHWELEETLLE